MKRKHSSLTKLYSLEHMILCFRVMHMCAETPSEIVSSYYTTKPKIFYLVSKYFCFRFLVSSYKNIFGFVVKYFWFRRIVI